MVKTTLKRDIGITLTIIAFTIYAALKFVEVVEKIDGEWVLKKERQDEIDRMKNQQDDAELYYLYARVDGMYKCYLCEPSNMIYMNKGEILKIGMTTRDKTKRYGIDWLWNNRAVYKVKKRGDIATVRKAEIEAIGNYPLLPENIKRNHRTRLVVPPWHKSTSLN